MTSHYTAILFPGGWKKARGEHICRQTLCQRPQGRRSASILAARQGYVMQKKVSVVKKSLIIFYAKASAPASVSLLKRKATVKANLRSIVFFGGLMGNGLPHLKRMLSRQSLLYDTKESIVQLFVTLPHSFLSPNSAARSMSIAASSS